MTALLLAIAILFQGIPVPAQQSGTITGVLRDTDGKPMPNTRVAAMPQPQDPQAIQDSGVMSALAETDAEGRYRLENVPPGKYYVVAGHVNVPTYYPGTKNLKEGKVVVVAAGAPLSGIDFRITKESAIRGPMGLIYIYGNTNLINGGNGPYLLNIPTDVQVEGGGPLPVSGPKGFVTVSLSPSGGGTPVTIDIARPVLHLQGFSADYKVTVENLPDGYAVKSMMHDKTDLRIDNLKIPAATFTALATASSNTAFNANIMAVTVTVNGVQLNPPARVLASERVSLAPITAALPSPPLAIVLTRTPAAASTGVRVTGKAIGKEIRSISISGVSGTFFGDGSFEFRGVPPGRHTIVTPKNLSSGKATAATLIVGDRDVEDVQLEATQLLPLGIQTPTPLQAPGSYPVALKLPLVTLRGKVIDSETLQSAYPGMVFLNGGVSGTSSSIEEDGTFRFGPLLPGSYNMEINLFAHQTEKRTVVVGDDGAILDIPVIKKP